MDTDFTLFFRLRKRAPLIICGFAALMLATFPFIPPHVAALFNITLVMLANLLGFWRWGLLATAWTILITWLMDTLFWHVGFDMSVYTSGGIFNLGLTLVFGIALAAKNRQMITDGLTGLYNDNQFRNMLQWEVDKANRYGRPLSLLMIDLDGFKPLNDRHGHLAGDQILRQFSQLLDFTRRESDMAARYGGDEFVLLLPETGCEGAQRLMQRLREEIDTASWHCDGQPVTVTASMGASELQQGQTAEQFLREADRALYTDKKRRAEADGTRSA